MKEMFKIVTLKEEDGDDIFVLQIHDGFLKWIDNEDPSQVCRVSRADMAYKFGRKKDAINIQKFLESKLKRTSNS